MFPALPNQKPGPIPAMIWWMVWFGILAGFFVVAQGFMRRTGGRGVENEMPIVVIAATEVVLSSVLRWVVLPRVSVRARAFVLFVIGLALADGAGILGVFLTREHRMDLVVLAALGIAQWVPTFQSRFPATNS